MKIISDFVLDNALELAGIGLFAGILLFNAPKILSGMEDAKVTRSLADAGRLRNEALLVDQKISEQESAIADSRIRTGNCVVVHSLTREGKLTTISEGQPVIKGELVNYYRVNPVPTMEIPIHHFIPVGHCVMDATGMTAKLEQMSADYPLPVARLLAKTGNKELIEQALADTSATLDPFVGGNHVK